MADTEMINWENTKIALSELKPWTKNPRQSTKTQARRILKSFERFGQVQPVSIGPDNSVYDGHQRLSALLTVYGTDYQIDARRADRELTDDERRALVITLHAGATGEWNWDELSSWQPAEMMEAGFDAELLKEWKRDTNALKNFLDSETPEPIDAEPVIDRAAELNEKWQVKTGDLWKIGEHRLLCGDSTKREDVERVMQGEKAELAAVDPPYNVGFDYDGETVDDTKSEIIYEIFSKSWFDECQRVSTRQIVTPGGNNLELWMKWFSPFHTAPWIKSNTMTNGKISRFWCWEPVLFFGEKWKRTRANDIFNYPIGMQKNVANHPCPKPLSMWADIIENYSDEKTIIYDSFGGSGTTIVACQNTQRKCRAIEISPNYCAIILERMLTAFPDLEICKI